MYGLVHHAIEGLVLRERDPASWDRVRAAAGLADAEFLSHEPYPDTAAYQLVGATATALGWTTEQTLEALGEFWLLEVAVRSYGPLIDALGTTPLEFLQNLPGLHARIQLHMPALRPPRFAVTHIGNRELHVTYTSAREGLAPFVVGLLRGVGKRFGVPLEVTLVGRQGGPGAHDVFRVGWP
jgi:hypothetical protein